MRITRHQAVQAHYVPDRVHQPRGPFPADIFDEPEINYNYPSEDSEDGAGFEPGSTAQNNFKPTKYYRCKACNARVSEHHLDDHVCEE